jgi:hypothetical protein
MNFGLHELQGAAEPEVGLIIALQTTGRSKENGERWRIAGLLRVERRIILLEAAPIAADSAERLLRQSPE